MSDCIITRRGSIGSGSVTPLSVTANGVYTNPSGYSPVTVDVYPKALTNSDAVVLSDAYIWIDSSTMGINFSSNTGTDCIIFDLTNYVNKYISVVQRDGNRQRFALIETGTPSIGSSYTGTVIASSSVSLSDYGIIYPKTQILTYPYLVVYSSNETIKTSGRTTEVIIYG